MSAIQNRQLYCRSVLQNDEQAAVAALVALCNQHEQLGYPLLLEASGAGDPADGPARHVLCVVDGALAGYAAIQPGPELEVMVFVHPAQRRQGLGRALVQAAAVEARHQGQRQLLLVADLAAGSGSAFLEALGARFRAAEYRLRLAQPVVERRQLPGLSVRPAGAADLQVLARVQAQAFSDQEHEVRVFVQESLQDPTRQYWLALLDGQPVGVLRIGRYGDSADFSAFGVLPAYRGRGIGRQLLQECTGVLLGEGWSRIFIEVATENRSALGLYLSCGFVEDSAYGYFEF